MFQYKLGTGEKIADMNMKVYKKFERTQMWLALSYRRSFDNNPVQELQQFTPIF